MVGSWHEPSGTLRTPADHLVLPSRCCSRRHSIRPAGRLCFGDIRQVSNSTTISPYGGDTDSSLDAAGAGGGVRIGTFLHPRWSLELGLDVATKETIDIEDPFVILIYPPIAPASRKSSTSFFNVSTTVGFHPPAIGRVRLGYRAGFAFVKGTYTSEYPIYAVPMPAGFLMEPA